MYYLQTRYYDPAIGRFINADCYASTGQGFIGCNMFAYCNNDPANNTDQTGTRHVVGTSLERETATERKQSFAAMNDQRGKSYTDITDELNSMMHAHAKELKAVYILCSLGFDSVYKAFSPLNTSGTSIVSAYYATGCFFASKERTDGGWDLKNNVYPYSDYFIYNGHRYSGQDIGNIHYGYVGSAVFYPAVLRIGAGGYQAIRGSHWAYWNTLFDEPRDYDMVTYGIQLYNQEGWR